MFRKIISNLAYSPAMIWKLSRYNLELNKEKTLSLWIILVILLNVIFVSFLYIFDGNPTYEHENQSKMGQISPTDYSNQLKLSIKATNITKGGKKIEDGETIDAYSRLKYTFVVENTSSFPVSTILTIDLSDLLEYATILNSNNSISIDQSMKELLVNLEPLEKKETSLILDTSPATLVPQVGSSYDCRADVKLGDKELSFAPNCPILKRLDVYANSLKSRHFNQEYVLIFTIFYLMLVLIIKILYVLRIIITRKEISTIRKILNTGGTNGY